MKICRICNKEKSLDNFCIRKDTNKYRTDCKQCVKSIREEHHKNNPQIKKEIDKKYNKNNKEKIKESRLKRRDSIRKYQKDWRERNKNNIQYKLGVNLRNRFNQALRRNSKIGSAVKDLGCSIEEFIKYIEAKWQPGMSWNNYGGQKGTGWEIDHIKPLSWFDLTIKEQLLEGCHYTNLQPMWSSINRSIQDKR